MEYLLTPQLQCLQTSGDEDEFQARQQKPFFLVRRSSQLQVDEKEFSVVEAKAVATSMGEWVELAPRPL